MLKLISNSVLASEIAEFLGIEYLGENIVIYNPANLENLKDNCMIYLEDNKNCNKDFRQVSEVLFFLKAPVPELKPYTQIITNNPLRDFLRTIQKFFTKNIEHKIHERATVEEGARVAENVKISAGCYIGSDVVIGEGTVIWENVVIKGKTRIGKNCVIKPNTILGSDIFSFVLSDDKWEQLPQIGNIILHDDVWIGANSSIEKGTMSDTVIHKGSRIDDLVQIGSNCIIGENTLIAAGSIISRDVVIGINCFLAPNVSIRDKIVVGDSSTVGLGAVVVKNIAANATVVGNPAKELSKQVKEN